MTTTRRFIIPEEKEVRLRYAITLAWELFFARVVSSRLPVNKEASMQLHFSSILHSVGELLCTGPGEIFGVELETTQAIGDVDITCFINDIRAAVELKCFRKHSKRGHDLDMYDFWKDIKRLGDLQGFHIKMFICLTDDRYYPFGQHNSQAREFSTRDGVLHNAGDILTPGWAGNWQDHSRDDSIIVPTNVEIKWVKNKEWYFTHVVVN